MYHFYTSITVQLCIAADIIISITNLLDTNTIMQTNDTKKSKAHHKDINEWSYGRIYNTLPVITLAFFPAKLLITNNNNTKQTNMTFTDSRHQTSHLKCLKVNSLKHLVDVDWLKRCTTLDVYLN